MAELEYLPPEAQEEAATYIAALTEALEFESLASGRKNPAPRQIESVEQWENPAGAWHELPDTLLEDLDQIRHSSPPTPHRLMKQYLLDANVLGAYLQERPSALSLAVHGLSLMHIPLRSLKE